MMIYVFASVLVVEELVDDVLVLEMVQFGSKQKVSSTQMTYR